MGKLAIISIMVANFIPFVLGLVPWNSQYIVTAIIVWIGGCIILIVTSENARYKNAGKNPKTSR